MPSDPPRTSLLRLHARRVEVPAGLAASAGLVTTGLVLPVMSIEKLVFWEDSYSILQGVRSLHEEGHAALAALIFAFSVVFPIGKLLTLAAVWAARMPEEARRRVLWWTKALGKWSMLDVFVVAVTVVLATSKAALGAEPRAGLYLFSAGVLLSMAVTFRIDMLARRGGDA